MTPLSALNVLVAVTGLAPRGRTLWTALAALVLLFPSHHAGAVELDTPRWTAAQVQNHPSEIVPIVSCHDSLLSLPVGESPAHNLGSFEIIINAGPNLASNAAALAAFNRAAAQWESILSDPFTVHIDAELADMGSSTIIGSASCVVLPYGYDMIRDAMVADSADEPGDSIVGALPTAAEATFLVPGGFSVGGLSATKANLKALGFTGLDAQFGLNDATLTLNSQFAFDTDNRDGVPDDRIDLGVLAKICGQSMVMIIG